MNPGELREVATAMTSETIREKGITTYNYVPISKFRCKVKLDKTKTFYNNDKRKIYRSLIFLCHRRSYFVIDNFIKYKDNMYRITDVIPFENGQYLQVYVESVES